MLRLTRWRACSNTGHCCWHIHMQTRHLHLHRHSLAILRRRKKTKMLIKKWLPIQSRTRHLNLHWRFVEENKIVKGLIVEKPINCSGQMFTHILAEQKRQCRPGAIVWVGSCLSAWKTCVSAYIARCGVLECSENAAWWFAGNIPRNDANCPRLMTAE